LTKSADFSVYVRDRKPMVRFTAKAYVLPRSGQRGIPVVSVNTGTVALEIYRIGDRNLLETVVGRDFQRNLDRYDLDHLAEERGARVWKGELAVEQSLNTDVTTAFPVTQAIGALAPGVYVMAEQPAGAGQADRQRQRGCFRLLDPQSAALCSDRPRGRRPRGSGRPRRFCLHRAWCLPLRGSGAGHDTVAQRPGHGRSQCTADPRG